MKEMKDNTEEKQGFAFGKQNYIWMIIGVVVLILGYILLSAK